MSSENTYVITWLCHHVTSCRKWLQRKCRTCLDWHLVKISPIKIIQLPTQFQWLRKTFPRGKEKTIGKEVMWNVLEISFFASLSLASRQATLLTLNLASYCDWSWLDYVIVDMARLTLGIKKIYWEFQSGKVNSVGKNAGVWMNIENTKVLGRRNMIGYL